MNEPEKTMPTAHQSNSTLYYTLGFVISIVLTLLAYDLVTHHLLSRAFIITCITLLAVLQFIVQLVFFLHLTDEMRPRYRLYMLLFMLLIVVIIVFGSVWIMNNLNYNMHMTPEQLRVYMQQNEGL